MKTFTIQTHTAGAIHSRAWMPQLRNMIGLSAVAFLRRLTVTKVTSRPWKDLPSDEMFTSELVSDNLVRSSTIFKGIQFQIEA